MRKLLGGIALAALAATMLHADPPGGKGHGGGNGGGNPEARGNGGGGKDRSPGPMQIGGPAREHGNAGGNAERQRGPAFEVREARGNDRKAQHIEVRPVTVERGQGRIDHGPPQDRAMPVQAQGPIRGEDHGRDSDARIVPPTAMAIHRPDWRSFDQRGLINGCPPGLAKKNNGCMPPGLAKQTPQFGYPASWWGLRGLNDVSGYRYYNGDLVRLSPLGAIAGYYPLLGGSLAIGNPWPSMWATTPLDPYYVNYYGLGDDYRYFDGAIYEVDPGTSAIEAIAALLTGDSFVVGQRVPLGYDVYNVPYAYRTRYIDGPDAYYRYSDGYIYRIDPRTQLIVAAIQLLG